MQTAVEYAPDNYIVGVRCSAEPVRFKVVIHTVPGDIEPGKPVYGFICPGSWFYFSHTISEDYADARARVNVTKYTGSLSFMARLDYIPVRLV